MTWDDIAVSIQAVPQRRLLVDRLTGILSSFAGDISITWQDDVKTCMEITADAFRSIANCGREWGLRFEDDAEPCPNFSSLAMRLIEVVPADVSFATFYNGRRVKIDELLSPSCWEVRPGSKFMMTQCVLVRSELAAEIAEWIPKWGEENRIRHPNGFDTAIAHLLKKRRMRYTASWPGLVQHRVEEPSFLGHRYNPNRRSSSYTKAFGEVPPL